MGKYTMTAPVAGWYKLGIGDKSIIPENGALILDNIYPEEDKVSLRKGYSTVYEITGDVQSIFAYEPNNEIISAVGSDIYANDTKISTTSYNNAKWQGVYMKERLFLCNSSDTMQQYYYNSTSEEYEIIDSTFTGTTLEFKFIGYHNGQFIGIKAGGTSFWYGDVGAISGALVEFDISQFIKRGGSLVGFSSWGYNSGSGLENYISFITSEGEVITYQGQDFSSTDNISIKENKYTARPLGNNMFIRWGNDSYVITELGLKSLQELVFGSLDLTTLNENIQGAFKEATSYYSSEYGWNGVVHPKLFMGIVNIPTEGQYITNIKTGAWCRFDLEANMFCVLSGDLYFCKNGGICLYGYENSDDGEYISSTTQTNYSQMGSNSRKNWTLFTPFIKTSADLNITYSFATDYKDATGSFSPSPVVGGFLWSYRQPVLWNSTTEVEVLENSSMSDDGEEYITKSSSSVEDISTLDDGDYYIYILADGTVHFDTSTDPTLTQSYFRILNPIYDSETITVSSGVIAQFEDNSTSTTIGEYWDEGSWSSSTKLKLIERSINGYGDFGSLILQTQTAGLEFEWFQTIFKYSESSL